ncbi:MAG: hypothetical protein J07HN6_01881 [Halonotius sp. J07HN6]|nr:MAG: hypothetical protein J07HN6_01881 [Halonotius sp. J07HN6]
MATKTAFPGGRTTRLASLAVAVAVGVGVWLLTTVTGSSRPALAAAVGGVAVGFTMLLCDTETPVGTVVGSLLLPAVSGAVVLPLVLTIRGLFPLETSGIESILRLVVGEIGVTIAAGVAAFGVTGTLDAEFGEGGATRLLRTLDTAVLGPVIVLIGLAIVRFNALTEIPALSIQNPLPTALLFQPQTTAAILLSFWGLSTVFIGLCKATLGLAPIRELAPQTKAAELTTALSRLHRGITVAFIGITVLTLGPLLVIIAGFDLLELAPQFSPILDLFAGGGLRRGLLQLSGLLALVSVVLWSVQAVTGRVTDAVSKLTPIPVAAGSALALALAAEPFVPELLASVPTAFRQQIQQVVTALTPVGVILAVIVVAMGILSSALAVVAIGGAIRFVPKRTAGSALATAGLAVGAVAAGIYGAGVLTVVAVVAISVFVWSVGDQSVATRAELGDVSGVQIEAIHAISALGLAGVGIALAWGLYTTALGRLAVSDGTLLGVLASVVGILILVVGVRG